MNKIKTQRLVLLALLTAIVVVMQLLGAFVRFGPFSVSLVLLPIVIGGTLLGIMAGTWLGFVFGAVVLISGDANAFLAINPAGAVIVVLLKGALAGLLSAFFYKITTKLGENIAAVIASVTCPIVNTGIFVIGSYVFFYSTLAEWGLDAGFTSVTAFIFVGLIGINFFIELGLNLVLCPVIIRLINYGQKTLK